MCSHPLVGSRHLQMALCSVGSIYMFCLLSDINHLANLKPHNSSVMRSSCDARSIRGQVGDLKVGESVGCQRKPSFGLFMSLSSFDWSPSSLNLARAALTEISGAAQCKGDKWSWWASCMTFHTKTTSSRSI